MVGWRRAGGREADGCTAKDAARGRQKTAEKQRRHPTRQAESSGKTEGHRKRHAAVVLNVGGGGWSWLLATVSDC